MKLHLDNVNRPGTGPGTFAQRLVTQLRSDGHQVVFSAEDAPVSLVFIEPSGARLAPRVVQRLDGVWFKPDEFETKNRAIKALYAKADAIVFQSEFDRSMVERWWGPMQRPDVVIGNGIDLHRVSELTIPALVSMRSQYDRVYVCSSNWHAQKRLGANIRLFHRLRALEPNSCLVVMGDRPDVLVADPHVFYTGPVGPDVYLQFFSAADWMLHLAWADHCPNVVVEALSQGTPVVCSEVGGTKELIGHGAYGLVLKEREPYDFGLFDYDHPPEVDVDQVTFLPTRHELDYSGIPSIDIKDVTARYVSLFEQLAAR